MRLVWHQVNQDEWRGDMPSLYIVAKRRCGHPLPPREVPDKWDVSLHDVNMEGLQIIIVPFESLAEVFTGALLWAKRQVAQWHHELQTISGEPKDPQ